jgi:hypothetical protein
VHKSSLLPLDIGFDLRATQMPVIVPDDDEIYFTFPPSSRGKETGPRIVGPMTRIQATAELKARGYQVAK